MKLGLSISALVLCGTLAWPADAATCGITTVTGVAFGSYQRFSGTALDSAGSVTYECSLFGALDVLTLQLSTGSSGTYFPRRMTSGANSLTYNLYLNAGRTVIFGDNTAGTAQYGPVTLNLVPVTVNVYGRVPPGQNVPVGSYADTIVATLLF